MSASVLFIGGWDPEGLAGVAVDLKVAAALGVHGSAALTALTARGSVGRLAIEPSSPELLVRQLDAGLALGPAAIKLGMLAGRPAIERLAARLADQRGFVVCDPVLCSSAGDVLLPRDAWDALRRLFPRIDLLTPNLDEAEHLGELPRGSLAGSPARIEAAAERLLALGARAVLIKGGHDAGGLAQDLYASGAERAWLSSERCEDARGTGCALAAAIAAAMSWGPARVLDVLDAIVVGKAYVHRGLRQGQRLASGARALAHAAWPVAADDLPWITTSAEAGQRRPGFPSTGPIGFYPIVGRAGDVARLARCGVSMVQLRVKDLSGEALRAELASAVTAVAGSGCRLVINDHVELAMALGAFGVHLGQEDLARVGRAGLVALAEAGLHLGVSTHTYAELARASALRPSYVALGPIYPTTLKAMRYPPQGPGRLDEWRALAGTPLVAIGGITLSRLPELRAADGVSIVADLRVGCLEARACAFLDALASFRPPAPARPHDRGGAS